MMTTNSKFRIQQIDDIKQLGIKHKDLIFKNTNHNLGLYVDDELVSVIGLREKPNFIKLQSNYTFEQHRNKGYFTELLKYVILFYDSKPLKADCLDSSVNIYLSLGFKKVGERKCKNYIIHKVERRN